MNQNKIIYSINISDLQTVADDELNRRLTKREIKILEDKIGDYFGWHDSISAAINDHIVNKKLSFSSSHHLSFTSKSPHHI